MQTSFRYTRLVIVLAAALLGSTLAVSASTSAQAQAPAPFGPELTTTTTCLGGNGRIDTSIVNTTGAPATYRLDFQGLSTRQIVVPAGDWGRIPITGRPDGAYSYQVTRDGTTITNSSVTVGCDGADKMVSQPEASVINACRGSNGYVLVQMANPTSAPRPYVIEFTGVTNRSQTAAPYGAAIRAVTGRPDGTYNLKVRTGATTVLEQAVTVACDAGPNPAPTPSPTPVPLNADDIAVTVDVQCPAIGEARVLAFVTNGGAADQPASLVVYNAATEAGELKTAIARAGQTTTLSQSDLAPSTYRITVSVDSVPVYDQTANISCAPTPTPVPPTPTAVPPTPVPPTPVPPTPVPPTPVPNQEPNAAIDTTEVQEDDGAINVTAALLGNDEDPDGDPLTIISIDTAGTIGEALLVDGVVTYNPNGQFEDLPAHQPDVFPNSEVPDFFTYTISDGKGGTDSATATMVILGNNDAPIAVDDFGVAITGTEASFDDWWANDIEIDQGGADLIFFEADVFPVPPAPTTQGGVVDPNSFAFRYTSAAGFTGFDTFIYNTEDGIGGVSNDVTLTVLVGAGPETPAEYEVGVSAQATVLAGDDEIGDKEAWFYFELDSETSLSLDSDCGFALQGGVEFRVINTSNNSVANLSCDQDEPRTYAAGLYAIRVFSANPNIFEVTTTFTFRQPIGDLGVG